MQYHITPVTIFKQNCSLVWCKQTKEAVLVDPGGEFQFLRQKIASLGIQIKGIWLTHGHLDHVGAVSDLAAFYNVPIIGPHLNEKPILASLPEQCKMFGVPFIPPFIPDYWLVDGAILNIGNLSFNVLHCPGHSPGHVIFWNKIKKIILMGDVLFNGSIGRTDFFGGNMSLLMQSIKVKIMSLSDDITFLPGHGPISTLGYERLNNPFLQ